MYLKVKVKGKNEIISIVDTSAVGKATVREYEENVIASDSEDKMKMSQTYG